MEEANENSPKSYEELHDESLQQEEEKRQRMENLRKNTVQWLKSDPAIQEFFNKYNSYYVDSFISQYAFQKSIFMEYSELYQKMADSQQTEYLTRAEVCLKEIQYKKLFDLRCQWGANLIKIDEIETSYDFIYWTNDILNCPFLTPIQQHEFDLYLQYAKSDYFDYNDHLEWPIFNSWSMEEEEEIELPEWFNFHNLHTGSNKYLQLPDQRGDKEDFYRELWGKEQSEKIEKKYETGELERPVIDNRPTLQVYNYDDIMNFMSKFENASTIRQFKSFLENGGKLGVFKDDEEDDEDYLNEQVEDIMQSLTSLNNVKLPVEANSDWRIALINAWAKYEKEQTIAALSSAYDNYLFRVQNNIPFESDDDREENQELVESFKEQIIRGRELNGEPPNLDF